MNPKGSFAILHRFPPPDLEKAWRNFLTRLEAPAHYDSPEFFDEPVWAGERPFAILALNRNSIAGVLTGLHREDEVISGQQSRPQVCVDGTADINATVHNLAEGLLTEAGSTKLITVYSWSIVPLRELESYRFRGRELEGDVVLDLTKGTEALFKELHASRRKNIRHSIRSGVEVFRAKALEDAEAFYHLHTRWHHTKRKKISTPQISQAVFSQRFERNGNFVFILAHYSGKLIAGITLRFFPGGLVEFSNHSSLDEFLHLKPNDLLQWKCIEWACQQGFRRCSLGGAHTFHRRFGGTIFPISRYRLDRTLLRRYDRLEEAMDFIRKGFHKLPRPVQTLVRRIR